MRAFPPLQRPIHHTATPRLDFHMPSHCSNVQSAACWLPDWTSACLSAASTSNPPRFSFPIGLPHAFPPLQRPICHTVTPRLDFLLDSHHHKVQFYRLTSQFWTSTRLSSASTSNPPHQQHGYTSSLYILDHPTQVGAKTKRAAANQLCHRSLKNMREKKCFLYSIIIQ